MNTAECMGIKRDTDRQTDGYNRFAGTTSIEGMCMNKVNGILSGNVSGKVNLTLFNVI